MKLKIELCGATFAATLPERIIDGQAFTFLVNDQPQVAVWHKKQAVLVLRNQQGLERHVQIRRGHSSRFTGESQTQVGAECRIDGRMFSPQAVVYPALPQGAVKDSTKTSLQVIRSQITGKILQVLVRAGDEVKVGQALLVIEAMKMENRVFSQMNGTVTALNVAAGDSVQTGKELLRLTP